MLPTMLDVSKSMPIFVVFWNCLIYDLASQLIFTLGLFDCIVRNDYSRVFKINSLIFMLQACLIADIVQHFVDAKLEFDACYVYEDVNRAIQQVHKSGLAHRGILADPHRYLVKNVCCFTLFNYGRPEFGIVVESFFSYLFRLCYFVNVYSSKLPLVLSW